MDDQNILPRSWFMVSIKTWKNACLRQEFISSRLKYSSRDCEGRMFGGFVCLFVGFVCLFVGCLVG